jgi:hypothetical protein
MAGYVRQAVVIVHGMGEQRPLDTLNGFISAALAPDGTGRRAFYSRPESVTGSYESRRFLAAPAVDEDGRESRAHTEFFEYHWAHLMQGNRIDDLWPTFRRMLLQPWRRVPAGLRLLWLVSWVLVGVGVWAFGWGPLSDLTLTGNAVETVVRTLLGAGLTAALVVYLLSRVLPRWLTTSFVDVVRYLDTSPRSYEARREIRKGFVDLLRALHDSKLGNRPRYQRIVVVAHSLGAYIAYDGISYLWGQLNHLHDGGGPEVADGLRELELAASALPDPPETATDQQVSDFQAAQRRLWLGLRAQGNPWRVTDLVTLGTPMYFADRLYTKNEKQFRQRVDRRELPTCPPHNEEQDRNNLNRTRRFYSWPRDIWTTGQGGRTRVTRRVIYEGAPFAVVRWTNMWFPAAAGIFGDWFGGGLAPLFGNGIRDIPISGNRRPGRRPHEWFRSRLTPAYAHALYFHFPDDRTSESVTKALRDAMALDSTSWLDA